MRILLVCTVLLLLAASCNRSKLKEADWEIQPFVKVDSVNPVLEPLASTHFYCPVRMDSVEWEAKDVFNPSAVVRDGKVYLLYRAEDIVGKHAGTSRLGLAISDDGFHFTRMSKPVFYPDNDSMKVYEWEGGVEDPRLVEDEKGTYILTYTAYDGKTARLCVATSSDLMTWKKHGLAFKDEVFRNLWSKSGAIATEQVGERFIARKIKGKYIMYWGDTHIYMATSEDLIHWNPVTHASGELVSVIGPREGMFDSDLVEPGPQAMIQNDGIILIYNSRNNLSKGDSKLPDGNYAAGQVLLDLQNPLRVIKRSTMNFLTPDKPYEITGQVNNVCFAEGLVYYKSTWFLYYGTADSKIAVATRQ